VNHQFQNIEICVVGLGYVGLPLALAFGQTFRTIGVDINALRIEELKSKKDKTGQSNTEDFNLAVHVSFETEIPKSISLKRVYIITVPTTVDEFKKPDLSSIQRATESIAACLKKEDVVIYESTVYPGCTEEFCVPLLEKISGLRYNEDFFVGYSPERINPGDKDKTLTKILKITSGSTPKAAGFVDELYREIIEAGTYRAPSIKVAEAAKLIENCQRDVNISFMNELALIFDRLNINTKEVLKAAGTKWNFLPFSPGLVGGHCISVDPYYLIQKAEEVGYYPDLVGAGRRINDHMGVFVANKCIKLMIAKNIPVKGSKALILGISFKENCSDLRNSKVIDIYHELVDYGLKVDLTDPLALEEEVQNEFGLKLKQDPLLFDYQLVILAVPHSVFLQKFKDLPPFEERVVFDVKGAWPEGVRDGAL
jgi:UDP-N-acetyl-D-galactosamine dehydrogenase